MGRKRHRRSRSRDGEKENRTEDRLDRLEKIILDQERRRKRRKHRRDSSVSESSYCSQSALSHRRSESSHSLERSPSMGNTEISNPTGGLNEDQTTDKVTCGTNLAVGQKIDDNILEAIGKRLEPENPLGPEMNEDIVVRWSEIGEKVLPADEKSLLLKKYLAPKNCVIISPPKLNHEVKASLLETVLTRDYRLVSKQEKTMACLSAMGAALSTLMKNGDLSSIDYS